MCGRRVFKLEGFRCVLSGEVSAPKREKIRVLKEGAEERKVVLGTWEQYSKRVSPGSVFRRVVDRHRCSEERHGRSDGVFERAVTVRCVSR